MKTNNKGFTLIELLVVITIITILATISIPQFAKYRIRAYNVVALSDLRNLKVDLEAYYADPGTGFRYPESLYGVQTGQGGWITNDQIIDYLEVAANRPTFVPSNSVEAYYGAATNGQVYVLGTKHTNGTSVYASTSHAGRIYVKTNEDWAGVSGTGTADMPTAPTEGTGVESQAYKDSWFMGEGWTAI